MDADADGRDDDQTHPGPAVSDETEAWTSGRAVTIPAEPLAYSEDTSADADPAPTSHRRATILAAAIVLIGCAVAATVLLLGRAQRPPSAQPSAPTTAAPNGPRYLNDKAFIDRMRELNVPIPDWRYVTDHAKALCSTLDELHAAPGTDTVKTTEAAVASDRPKWNEAQVHYFVAGSIDFYCPKYWGPTKEEIAQMPPDDRYLALLGDRIGFWHDTPEQAQNAINSGNQICAQIRSGLTPDQVGANVYEGSKQTPYFTRERADTVVRTAMEVYCPRP